MRTSESMRKQRRSKQLRTGPVVQVETGPGQAPRARFEPSTRRLTTTPGHDGSPAKRCALRSNGPRRVGATRAKLSESRIKPATNSHGSNPTLGASCGCSFPPVIFGGPTSPDSSTRPRPRPANPRLRQRYSHSSTTRCASSRPRVWLRSGLASDPTFDMRWVVTGSPRSRRPRRSRRGFVSTYHALPAPGLAPAGSRATTPRATGTATHSWRSRTHPAC